MKLERKFLLLFLSVSLIPLVFFSLYTQSRYSQLIDRNLTEAGSTLTGEAASQANSILENMDRIIENLYLPQQEHISMIDDLYAYAEGNTYTDLDIYNSSSRLKYISQNISYFSDYINGIFIFTPDGAALGCGSDNVSQVPTDYSPLEDDWYRQTLAQKGGTCIFGPSVKEFLGNTEPSISFCTALYSVSDRTFLGVLVVDCAEDVFDLSGANTLPGLAVLTVSCGDDTLYTNQNEVEDPGSGSSLLEFEQELNASGLTLHVSINKARMLRQLDIPYFTILYTSVLFILSSVILSVLLSRTVTRPISVLSGKMRHFSENEDLSLLPWFDNRDEIGILYRSYEQMLTERQNYIRNELENRILLLDTQMRSLKSQINAHFLYNTLESINSIAVLRHVPEIASMSKALGNMFRYSINSKNEQVPLSMELTHVRNYISIQSIRFDNAFTYEEDIPPALNEVPVLRLILQPLVENALFHGLNYCRSGDQIKVSASAGQDHLILSVSDNGAGIPPEKLKAIRADLDNSEDIRALERSPGDRIGLSNIQTRLRLYYRGKGHLEIASAKEGGAVVRILLPLEVGSDRDLSSLKLQPL